MTTTRVSAPLSRRSETRRRVYSDSAVVVGAGEETNAGMMTEVIGHCDGLSAIVLMPMTGGEDSEERDARGDVPKSPPSHVYANWQSKSEQRFNRPLRSVEETCPTYMTLHYMT